MKRGTTSVTKFRRLCLRLKKPSYAVVGILESLWHMTAKECPRGDIGRLSNEDIAFGIDWDGDPDELVDGLRACRWLDDCPVHRLVVHDWSEHTDDATHGHLYRSLQTFADGTKPKRRGVNDRGAERLEQSWNEKHPDASGFKTVELPLNTEDNRELPLNTEDNRELPLNTEGHGQPEPEPEPDINNYNLGGERGGVGGENHSEESPPCGASPAVPDSPPGRDLVQRASSPRRKPGGDSKFPEPVMGQCGLPERVVTLAPSPPDGGVLIEPGGRAEKANFVASEICEAMPPSHNTEAMFVAIRDYVAMRRRTRLKSWDPVTVGRKSAEWAKFPAEAVIAALDESTSNQYAGVFPAKHMPRGGKKPYDPVENARRNLEALGIDPDCMEGDDGQE